MDDPRLPSMRAADADRERVLEVVRQAHAEGRLTTPEFYERLDGVYLAKTYAELDELVSDLPAVSQTPAIPAPPARAPAAPAEVTRALGAMPKGLRALWATWATAVSINVLIWLIVTVASVGNMGDDGWPPYFWPIWVAGPWGLVLGGITATWWLNRNDGQSPPALPPGSG